MVPGSRDPIHSGPQLPEERPSLRGAEEPAHCAPAGGPRPFNSRPALASLQQLYALLTLQADFFRPLRKLVTKRRLGAKVVKRYDKPRTPYQRLLDAGILEEPAQAAMEQQFLAISPAQAKGRIDQLLRELWQAAERPNAREKRRVG